MRRAVLIVIYVGLLVSAPFVFDGWGKATWVAGALAVFSGAIGDVLEAIEKRGDS